MTAVIETSHLTKRYGPTAALTDCSFSVQPGEVFGLLGPNGSGKTTLLRLLLGYLRPSGGSAAILGRDCFRERLSVHRSVAYVPGEVRLWRNMSGQDLLCFIARLRGTWDLQRARHIANRLQLDLTRKFGQMSTGMKQKLVLCSAFAADAEVLILDEPTANLDPTMRSLVATMVGEARSAGRTVIFSSHILTEVEKTCDRVVVLQKGRLAHLQVIADLRRGHRIRARLVGSCELRPPSELAATTSVSVSSNEVTIEVHGEFARLLPWLATLPLADVQIVPFGLDEIYHRIHPVDGEA